MTRFFFFSNNLGKMIKIWIANNRIIVNNRDIHLTEWNSLGFLRFEKTFRMSLGSIPVETSDSFCLKNFFRRALIILIITGWKVSSD